MGKDEQRTPQADPIVASTPPPSNAQTPSPPPPTATTHRSPDFTQARNLVLRTLLTPYPRPLVSLVGGNAPFAIKEVAVKWLDLFHAQSVRGGWGHGVGPRMEMKEVWVSRYELGVPELVAVDIDSETLRRGLREDERVFGEERPVEAKVVVEVDVRHGMLSGRTAAMAEGCIFYFVDECTAIAAAVLNAAEGRGKFGQSGVSQSINVLYHSPAPLGTRIRLICTSTSSRSLHSKCEVWDTKNRRLVATGTQLHMQPSSLTPTAWL